MKEDTSSSVSGLHFGHYKASTHSAILSHFHALKATLLMKRGIVLERWSRGLSVMIEKMFGCTLVSKLRSILLMEADFNFANKTVFGMRMMDNVRKFQLMPDEIFSEKNRTAEDGSLAKILCFDISRQTRRPFGIASVDAENCYDRVAHAMASLCFQAFGVRGESAQTMLATIQEMKFFLRTAFGDSSDFAGSTMAMKTQGLCQGNGAAPAGWAVLSIIILNSHKREGHGAKFACPISEESGRLSAILFVDDTDLLHIDMENMESIEETHEALQRSVSSWGTKLIATGGSMKPAKCFYYLVDYDWLPDSSWRYHQLDDEEQERLQVKVPLSSGGTSRIQYLGPDHAIKTLGVMTCPSGDPTAALDRMKTMATDWIETAKAGKMHRREVWFMLARQFWPRVGFGIGCNTAYLPELENCLRRQYFDLLPLGGFIRSAPVELRTLDVGFGGIGCPHLGVECLLSQLNKLLMHYGSPSTLGVELQTSMELFVLELGLSATEPFSLPFKRLESLVTHSWLKTIWEKCDKFQIDVQIGNIQLRPPREGDRWLMQVFIDQGYSIEDLRRLNQVRIYQQVIFLSDVLSASGRQINHDTTRFRPGEEKGHRSYFLSKARQMKTSTFSTMPSSTCTQYGP